MVNYQKTSIHCIKRTGKSFGLLFDILSLDAPCSVAIVYRDKEYARYIDDFLQEHLPYGIEYKLIHVDEYKRGIR